MQLTRSARTSGLLAVIALAGALAVATCTLSPRTADAASVTADVAAVPIAHSFRNTPQEASVVGLLVVSRDSLATLVVVQDTVALDSVIGRQLLRHAVPIATASPGRPLALVISADSLSSGHTPQGSAPQLDGLSRASLLAKARRSTMARTLRPPTAPPIARVIAPRGVVSIDRSTLTWPGDRGGSQ